MFRKTRYSIRITTNAQTRKHFYWNREEDVTHKTKPALSAFQDWIKLILIS